ncbi:MAG: hypothetical protein E8D42_10820 [Nitrospira sp.]|nr:MAG: hypothetical protein E8D42_10820 [Nitrospira sp.]
MKIVDELIETYLATQLDATTVRSWYQRCQPSEELLSAVAERIGSAFLARRLDFEAASGLLNQLMPLVGFETAPRRFWEFYVAFENAECSGNSDRCARQAVKALTSSGSA